MPQLNEPPDFPGSPVTKNLPASAGAQKTWVPSLGLEEPPEKEMAPYSSTPAWKIPCTEEPGHGAHMGCHVVHGVTNSWSQLNI